MFGCLFGIFLSLCIRLENSFLCIHVHKSIYRIVDVFVDSFVTIMKISTKAMTYFKQYSSLLSIQIQPLWLVLQSNCWFKINATAIPTYQWKKSNIRFCWVISHSSLSSFSVSSSLLALLLALHPPPFLHPLLALRHPASPHLLAAFHLLQLPRSSSSSSSSSISSSLKLVHLSSHKKRFDGWKSQREYKDCAWLIYRCLLFMIDHNILGSFKLFALNLFCFLLTSICS